MVDDLTPQTAPTGDPVADPGKKPGFLATKNGRVIAIAAAGVGFLVVVGIVAAVVMTFLGNSGGDDLTPTPGAKASKPTTSTAESQAEPVEPDDVPLSDIFTFRDVFEPLVKPAPSDEESSSSETSATADGEAGTLYLQNIVVEDGVSKAVLEYNGTVYKLAQGGMITGTPWQVLSIGSSSVVMLYGDSQISLSVGQGVVDSSTATK